jgi:solute carrier family 25 carnitine/acylcarnitine transporter 20/29
MIGAVPIQNAVLMTGYGYGKRWTTKDDDDDDNNNVLFGVFIGGTVGGILQSFVMSPIELIKVSQQVVGKSVSAATTSVISGLLPSITTATTSTSSKSSSVSAWRGLGATLLRDGIPHGAWFASYEFAKVELTKMRNDSSSKVVMLEGDHHDDDNNDTKEDIAIPMLSGAFAATTAWGVGYPFDLIKTRIQAGKSTGIIATARDIVKESSSSKNGGGACYGL